LRHCALHQRASAKVVSTTLVAIVWIAALDPDYMKMRTHRLALISGPPGPDHPLEHFKRSCAGRVER